MMAVSKSPVPPRADGRSGNGEGSPSSYNSTVTLTPPIDGEKSATASTPLDAGTKQMYSHMVREALDKLRSGNAQPLDEIVQGVLQPNCDEYGHDVPVDGNKLSIILRTLSRDITRLDCYAAVSAIVSLLDFGQWSEISPRVTESYVQFFSVLASGNPRWWSEIASRVVAQFSEPRLDLAPHHNVVSQILQLVPTSAAAFAVIFSQQFPYKMSAKAHVACYVRSLLRVTEYAPDQMRAVWELVIQRLVELDVESIQMFDEDTSADEDSDYDVSDDDVEDVTAEVDTDSDGDDDAEDTVVAPSSSSLKRDAECATDEEDNLESEAKRQRMAAPELEEGAELTAAELALRAAELEAAEPMTEKVDAVMEVILSHLSQKFTTAAVQSGEASPLFIMLLDIFKRIVLPTSTPQAVQFLWFYIAHSHKDMMDAFLVTLLDASMSPVLSINQRQKAMQYIASFVARSRGLTRTQIIFVVSYLASWVQSYVAEREHEVDQTMSMARFRMFYSAVQALFYIFCFRRSELRATHKVRSDDAGHDDAVDDTGEWEAGLDKMFQAIIMTKFNPLKYCESSVVSMFAQVSCDEGVAYCFTILERNRVGRVRNDASKQAMSSDLSRLSAVLWPNYRDFKLLESYFPFDPLSLKEASKVIEPLYVEWADVCQNDSGTEQEDHMEDRSDSDDAYGA